MGDATTLGQVMLGVATIITTLTTFAVQLYREKRNREWDLADRERARMELALRVAETHHTVVEKIDQNTVISEKAFTEANHVNQKILDLKLELQRLADKRSELARERSDDIKHDLKDTATKVEETKAIVEDTHAKVESIEKKLP